MAQLMHFVEGKVNEMMDVKGTVEETNLTSTDRLIRCYACFAPGQKLKPCAYVVGKLRPTEVEIRVHYCGVCHTDLSFIRNELGMTEYPFAPGHEAVGIVSAVGGDCTRVNVGDRVGAGFFKESCGECELCSHGRSNLCLDGQPILGKNFAKGGWSDYVRVDEEWVIHIPDQIKSEEAGPFLCAGCTVYAPLIHWHVGPGSKVGLIGLGGLGHLFVQFASHMGAEVTVFSTSTDKFDDATRLGACRLIKEGSDEEKSFEQSQDFILNTAYANLDWSRYMKLLKPGGVLCMVGFPPKNVTIDPFELIYREKKLVGSNVASPKCLKEMFEFIVKHDIHPAVEIFDIDEVNDVIDKFDEEGFRYRAVLDVQGGFRQPAQYAKILATGG